jgi:hypothetical protein
LPFELLRGALTRHATVLHNGTVTLRIERRHHAPLHQPPPLNCHAMAQERESELAEMLASAQASLEAMQKLHTAAQNQLFELQSRSEEAEVGKQVGSCWEAAGGRGAFYAAHILSTAVHLTRARQATNARQRLQHRKRKQCALCKR